MTAVRTTLERASAGYDEAHERALVAAITNAIFQTSLTTDGAVLALRTGEVASALLTCLAGTIALSPAAVRSPISMRKTVDELGRRLRRRVANAATDPVFADFLARCFRDGDRERGGNA
jgi:hypothetical protein